MINVELAQIALIVPSVVFLFYLLFSWSGLTTSKPEKLSFLTGFPYEAYEKKKNSVGFYALIVFLASEALLNVSMFVNYSDTSADMIGLLVLSATLTVTMFFLIIRIHTLTASRERIHLTRFYLMGLGLFLLASLNGLIFLNLSKMSEKETAVFVLSIMQFVISLTVVFILVNPRLRNWAQLEKVVGKDGGSSLKRPKPFVLAFSEWSIIFLSVLAWFLAGLCNYLIIS